jgi:hypothetical protein
MRVSMNPLAPLGNAPGPWERKLEIQRENAYMVGI